jgi:putative DNA primase/helicase
MRLARRRMWSLSAEDGLADTLRPRLDAAGADVTRVHCLTGWQTHSEGDEFTLADIHIIGQALADKRPGLAVIDPLQAYLGSQGAARYGRQPDWRTDDAA